MLGTLDPAEKSRWSQHVNRLVHAYNCTKNDATGHSPYYLLFGREARLPVDLCFGTVAWWGGSQYHHQYVERMKSELQRAYQLATETAQKSQQRNKRLYDKQVKRQTLEVGDRVLIKKSGTDWKAQTCWQMEFCTIPGDRKAEELTCLPVWNLNQGWEV